MVTLLVTTTNPSDEWNSATRLTLQLEQENEDTATNGKDTACGQPIVSSPSRPVNLLCSRSTT